MRESSATIAKCWADERALYRAVIRWRALYSRMRPRMEQMARDDIRAADRLHCRLKDAEYAVIDAHQAVARRLDTLATSAGLGRLSDGYHGRMC